MAISPPRSRARAIGKCDQDSIKIALTSFSPRFAARSSGVSTRRRRLETTRVAHVYCLDVFARLTRAFNSSSDAVKLAWPCAAMSIASARPWWCRAFRELAWTSGKIFIARPQLAVFGCPVRPIAAFHVRPFTVRTARPRGARAEGSDACLPTIGPSVRIGAWNRWRTNFNPKIRPSKNGIPQEVPHHPPRPPSIKSHDV